MKGEGSRVKDREGRKRTRAKAGLDWVAKFWECLRRSSWRNHLSRYYVRTCRRSNNAACSDDAIVGLVDAAWPQREMVACRTVPCGTREVAVNLSLSVFISDNCYPVVSRREMLFPPQLWPFYHAILFLSCCFPGSGTAVSLVISCNDLAPAAPTCLLRALDSF